MLKYLFFLNYRNNFLDTQKQVRISQVKRAIGVRVIEVYCIYVVESLIVLFRNNYENTPIQIYWKFHHKKTEKF